jgi:hypothetical protein
VFWAELGQPYPPPYLYATYHGLDKLATPHFEVFFFSHVHGQEQFEEIQDGGLGLAEEGSHSAEMVCDG